MDRFVLVTAFCKTDEDSSEERKCLEPQKQIYDRLRNISSQESGRKTSAFPACSLSGSPAAPRWYFALQACHGASQFCSFEWEELGSDHQKRDSEEERPTAVEECLTSLRAQEAADRKADQPTLIELIDEAAEGLHLLSDQLPPAGKALLDVVVLGSSELSPPLKDLLPLLGALKHMSCWHAAKISVVTQHATGWQKVASSLGAGLVDPADLDSCINHREMWRGDLVIREKKFVSELRFDGFSLHSPLHRLSNSNLLRAPCVRTDHKLHSEVFHYYAPVLDLVQLVDLSDLPSFLMSTTEFELVLSGKSMKAQLLLDQLRSLRGKVGALFSLSCIITPVAQPAASQLTSQRWRETLARRPKSLTMPDVEVKGESAPYFLLVQGSDDAGRAACRVRMLHSDSQINGAAAMATVCGLLREKSPPSSGVAAGSILRPLPCLRGDRLLERERKATRVQTLVLKEYIRRREEAAASPTSVPVNKLTVILRQARDQYLRMVDCSLPTAASCLTNERASKKSGFQTFPQQPSEWPERSVLLNIENQQRRRQKKRIGLLGPGSTDSLLGPKDTQRGSSALLDAKELLKHFTSDGLPTAELQPLAFTRGINAFQLSPDLTPRKVTGLPFSKASTSHYHGIEFCLDTERSLERDQAFARLQSRLIRFETQTTCSREPCTLPLALSPAPSPAVMSEPGSVPDGESLQNNNVARVKRSSWEADIVGGHPRKRLVKSESSDSLCSQSSSSSGTHPIIRSLRQQPGRSQSTSSSSSSVGTSSLAATRRTSGLAAVPCGDKPKPQQQSTQQGAAEDKPAKESRSQKHNRMLQEVVAKTLKHHGICAEHQRFEACSKRLFDISKFYLKDLKTSRGLHDEMKKAAGSNVKQVIDWVLEKMSKTR